MIQDEDVGFNVISTDDIDDIGVDEVIRRIRARIADNPVYLRRVWQSSLHLFAFGDSYLLLFRIASLDIDVIGTPPQALSRTSG